MMKSEQRFRNKIAILSFICSMFVIWIHTTNMDTYGINASSEGIGRLTYYVEQVFGKFITFATPMFFFISGFLFFRSYELKKTMDKYKSRIKSIVIPYLVWNTIYYLFFAIFTNVPSLSRFFNAEKYELSLRAWISALWTNEYYTLWFLKNLIVFFALSPVFYILLKNWKRIPSGFVVLMVVLCAGYFTDGNELLKRTELLNGIAMFAAGSYIAINHKDKALYTSTWLSGIGLFVIALMVATDFRYLNDLTQVLLFIAVWYALDLLRIKDNGDMPYWMRITFFTYVAHDMILEVLEKIWLIIFGTRPIFALIDYLFMPFVTLGVLVAISLVLRKHTPKLWNILNGFR